ncbi:hypothetical protein N9K77_00990 [bacterium]|nr:hypothetical protein [bacterium]
MAKGRLNKFFKETTLVNQAFIRDNKKSRNSKVSNFKSCYQTNFKGTSHGDNFNIFFSFSYIIKIFFSFLALMRSCINCK